MKVTLVVPDLFKEECLKALKRECERISRKCDDYKDEMNSRRWLKLKRELKFNPKGLQ